MCEKFWTLPGGKKDDRSNGVLPAAGLNAAQLDIKLCDQAAEHELARRKKGKK